MMDASELTCQELVALVTDYLEDALAPAVRRQFDAHLSECDECTVYLAQMRRTLQLTGRLGEGDVSTPARDRLLAAFRAWKQGTA